MKGYADLGDMEENKRIDTIGRYAMNKKEVVAFVVEDNAKADRYVARLKEGFPTISVRDRFVWPPEAGTITVNGEAAAAMNLTGRPVYRKGMKHTRTKPKTKPATPRQRKRWDALCAGGCIIDGCKRRAGIHHCETGAGGRKDHNKVLPLCHHHHQGDQGIHPMTRKKWEAIFGTEQELMIKAAARLRTSA
jgi:hypothetical protein